MERVLEGMKFLMSVHGDGEVVLKIQGRDDGVGGGEGQLDEG